MIQLELFTTTPDDIQFVAYHHRNPQIWEAFEQKTLETIRKGHRHYGSKGIFEVIRWSTPVRGGGPFKVNNIYTPYYARLFEAVHQEYAGFFYKRASKFDQSISI
ncbi:MAG: hypothetical protein WAU01_14645 [Saprospiraceae bacterium]